MSLVLTRRSNMAAPCLLSVVFCCLCALGRLPAPVHAAPAREASTAIDFANLSLVGNAAVLSDRLRLTPTSIYQAGAAWLPNKQPVRGGFTTTFQFCLTHPGSDVADGFAVDDQIFSRLESTQVRSALETLPAEQREPIEMGFFGGITHEEIARRTGVRDGDRQ